MCCRMTQSLNTKVKMCLFCFLYQPNKYFSSIYFGLIVKKLIKDLYLVPSMKLDGFMEHTDITVTEKLLKKMWSVD